MKKIFYIFLSRPVTSAMLFLSITVVGIVSVFNIPVELSPHAEFPRLSVSISWSGVSPEAVEAFVTSPIEAELATIKGVKKITSRSTEGSSYINLEFHPETKMDFARIEISEKIHSLKNELPFGVSTPRLSDYIPDDLKDLQGFLTYTVSSDENASIIRKYIIENMLYPLRAINGVSDVTVRGGTERQIEIIVDYQKAKLLNISNSEIQEAVRNAEVISSAGSIKRSGQQQYVNISNEVNSTNILYDQSVKSNNNGSAIRLKDIATINDDYKEPESFYRINGKETVSLIISKELGTNTLEVANKVKKKIAEYTERLPQGYVIKKEIDKSESIENELAELYKGGIYSFFVVLIILLIIFRSLKTSMIISASILFALLFSFTLFYIFELPLNIITISAFILGFGFIVDNSIVVVDFLEKHGKFAGIKRITVLLKNIFPPVFASTITTIAVFLPLLFLTGELRIYFEQFALGVVFTLIASFVVSFTVVPLLYYKSFSDSKRKTVNVLNKFSKKVYTNLLAKIIMHKKISLTLAILLIGLPVWLLPARIETPYVSAIYNGIFDTEIYDELKPYVNYALGGSLNLFFNHISRGEVWQYGEPTYLMVRLELPNGNEIKRINELTNNFEEEILQYEGQFKYVTANVYSEENAFIRVEFTDEQSLTAFPYMLKNYLTAYATRLGGLDVGVYGFGPGFYNGGSGTSSYSVIIKGFNYKKVRELAEDYRKLIVRNPRIDNVDIDKSGNYWAKDTYEVVGHVDRTKLVSAQVPLDYLSTLVAKNTRGNIGYNKFRIGDEEVSYEIKFSNYKNIQLDELENLILRSPEGNWIKVKDVFDFKERKVLSAINREDQQYVRYITFDYKGPYRYGNEFIKSSIEKMIVPEGYNVKPRDFMFRFGEQEEIDIWLILLMAVVLIFMVSAGLFESFKKPLIIIVAIPFAIIGTIFIFYIGEYNIDRGAYAGLLLLIGLSVNNSIILVDYLSNNYKNGSLAGLYELSYNRVRPILTTTITTIGALIPLLFSAESTFWKSLALSVIGGLGLSSILILLLVPLLFQLFSRHPIK